MNPQLAWQARMAELAFTQMVPILKGRRRLRDIQRVVDDLHERANAVQTGLLAKQIEHSGTAPECRSGCDHCCRIRVRTTVPEAVRIASWLTEVQPLDELALLTGRLNDVCEQLDALSPKEYFSARIECPLLIDHRCEVHQVRALPCRIYLSWSAQACYDHFILNQPSQIPKMEAMDDSMLPLAVGLSQATEAAGAGPAWVCLHHAVRDALVPGALKDWQQGRNIFRASSAPPLPEILRLS